MVTFEAPGLSSIGTMLDGTAPNDLIGILQLWVLPSLTTISFPNLTILGSQFQLANCSSLEAINGFPRLSRIGGSLNLLGNFSSISFPSLEYVGGNVMIVSSDPAFNCPLQGLESAGGIKGRVVCGASGNTSATSTAPLPNVTAVNPSATDLNSPTDHSSRSVASRGINIVSRKGPLIQLISTDESEFCNSCHGCFLRLADLCLVGSITSRWRWFASGDSVIRMGRDEVTFIYHKTGLNPQF
jgi:hypothetical protein